ncbi:hypothetical protein PRIPAC_83071, partial [Pristionchus pacificus]|uniref:G protein-coupled receptor n=1 Tax=Pristionchus pacificus TaxID=54126 RepID=A0A2A6CQC8_PRIPA
MQYQMAKNFVKPMIEKNHGHVVTIASIAGKIGGSLVVDYCASKFAAVGFHESLAAELNKKRRHQDDSRLSVLHQHWNRLVSILEPEYVVDCIMEAVLTNKAELIMPRTIYAVLAIHNAIKQIRHAFTIISIIFAIPCLFVIVSCSKKVTTRYSKCIALIVMLGVANDLVLQWMWDPLLLAPTICYLRDNPLIPLPGSSHLYYKIWATIIDLNVPVFFACFMERHQAVQSPGSRWVIAPWCRDVFAAVSVLIGFAVTYLLRIAEMSEDSQQQLLMSLVARWSTVDVMRAGCYDYYSFLMFDLNGAFGLIVCTLFVTAISLHTFGSIRKTSSLSDAVKSFNVSMSRVLAIQAIVPLVFIAFPIIASLGCLLANVQSPLHASLCHLLISAHSPVHSLVLLTATPIHVKLTMENYLYIHNTIKKVRHACTVIPIIFAVPCLFVIVSCSKRVTKRYSLCIAMIVMIWAPLMLGPSLCFLRDNPLIQLPGGCNIYYVSMGKSIGASISTFTGILVLNSQSEHSSAICVLYGKTSGRGNATVPVVFIIFPIVASLICILADVQSPDSPSMESYLHVHYTIIKFRHACTILAIIFAIPSLFVIFTCSKTVTKRYSLFIAMIVMLGVANDVVFQWMWDPILLAPAICILRLKTMQDEFWVTIIGLNISLFYACFTERHQDMNFFEAVQSPGSRWVFPLKFHYIFGAVVVLLGFAVTNLLRSIAARWPTVDVMRASCYDYFPYLIFDVNSSVGLLLWIMFVATISFHTFVSIRQTSSLSEAMKSFNVSMSKVLAIQAMVPVVFIAFPNVVSLICMLANVESPVYIAFCNLLVATHSPVHSIVLLTITPIYRKKLMETARC